MMAVLRHIYGLPYPADSAEFDKATSLLPYALVYVTAEKYQIHALKIESCSAMSDILLKKLRAQGARAGMALLPQPTACSPRGHHRHPNKRYCGSRPSRQSLHPSDARSEQ